MNFYHFSWRRQNATLSAQKFNYSCETWLPYRSRAVHLLLFTFEIMKSVRPNISHCGCHNTAFWTIHPLNTPPYSDLILQVASTTKQTDTGVPSILEWTTTRHDILRTTNKDDSSSLSGSGFALPAKFSQIRSTSTKSVFNHQGAEFMPKSRATDRPMRFGPRYVESGHHTIRFVGETFTTHHRSSLDSCAKSWTHGCHVYPGHWFLLPIPLGWVYCPVTISPPSALYQAQSNRSISWETKINSWRVGKNFPTHTRRILFNISFIACRDRWRRTIREWRDTWWEDDAKINGLHWSIVPLNGRAGRWRGI